MRWLIGHPGPQFSVHDMYAGWVEALRGLGEEVYTFNLDRRLQFYDTALMEAGEKDAEGRPAVRKAMSREQAVEQAAYGILGAAYQTWPDVVLIVSAFFTPPALLDMMRGRGHKIVLLHSESPYQDEEQLVRAAHADLNLVNDPSGIDAYRALGPAEYMPHAYRPQVHYPRTLNDQQYYDLSFIGTGFPSRIRFFEDMDLTGLNVRLAGMWMNLPDESPLRNWTTFSDSDCVDNADTADTYRRSRAGINFYRREAENEHVGEGWACGPREIELAATRTFFLRDPRPESDELFPMLPSFASAADASETLRWYLARDHLREQLAARARDAIASRTFDSNARQLLRLLDRQPVKI